MKRLHKFLSLPRDKKYILIKALLFLGLVRLGLWLLPFQRVLNIVTAAREGNKKFHKGDRYDPEDILWAIQTASQYVPRSRTCLILSLAAQSLLNAYGHPARLHFGVAKRDGKELRAHAWVESEGRIVFGGFDPGFYSPLLE